MKTKRIGFSKWTKEDKNLAINLWGNEDVAYFICKDHKLTQAECYTRLQCECENESMYHVQYWPIFSLSDGMFLGCCGLRPFPEEQSFEIGVHLCKEAWGNRYAMEASQCVLQYAFSTLKAAKVYAGHHPANRKSTNVLKALGFTYIGDNYYPPTGLMHPSYELTRNSFEIL